MSKNKGPVPCIICDRFFVSIADLRQHARDKHNNPPTQAPTVGVQPPAQEPQVQGPSKSVSTPTPSVSETIICEHCLAPFASLRNLKQHKIATHGWKCTKCPALPPFESGAAWQTHFNAVHAVVAHSGEITDTKGKKVATPIDEGKINDQRSDVNRSTSTETQKVVIQPKPSSSGPGKAKNSIISSPPPEVSGPSVSRGQTALTAPDDKPDLSTTKGESQRASSNSEDRTLLSSKGPTLNVLVEIDPEPRRGRDETTYEIASDTWSPAMTFFSIGAEQHEEEYDIDMSPSHSSKPLNGSSLQNGQDIIFSPRGPKTGERRALDATVAENNQRCEPDLQTQNGLDGVTLPNTKQRYERVRSDSPTFSSRGAGIDTNRGDPPHDSLRTLGSKTGSLEVHFDCRICLSDPTPTSNLTATHCGHLFCYECIAAEVLRTSRCPVCKNVLALYCLFKLDVAS